MRWHAGVAANITNTHFPNGSDEQQQAYSHADHCADQRAIKKTPANSFLFSLQKQKLQTTTPVVCAV